MASLDHALRKPVFKAHGFDAKWLIIGAAVLIVAWLALVPLVFLIWQSFATPATPDMPALFTFANYANVYTSSETFKLLGNSVGFASGAATASPRSSRPV